MIFIMSINQVFLCTIVASFAVFVHAQSVATDITVDKFLGRWYVIAATNHGIARTECDWFYVSKDLGNDTFKEIYHAKRANTDFEIVLRGTIINSTMSIRYPVLKKESITMKYTIERHNGDEEWILAEQDTLSDFQLISRKTTASVEAEVRFRYLVAIQRQTYIEIKQCDCPHDD